MNLEFRFLHKENLESGFKRDAWVKLKRPGQERWIFKNDKYKIKQVKHYSETNLYNPHNQDHLVIKLRGILGWQHSSKFIPIFKFKKLR